MASSLYALREFFKAGRKANGGYMGENEDMLSATHRNLSLCPDAELLSLRDAALLFAKEVEAAYQERRTEFECGDCGATSEPHHCPAWCDVSGCDTEAAVSSCHQRTR